MAAFPVPAAPATLRTRPGWVSQVYSSEVHWLQVGCRDRDECGPDGYYCGSNTDCTNLPGSYTCSCKSGYPHGSPSSRCYAPANIGTNYNINIRNHL